MKGYWKLVDDDKHVCSKCGHPAIPMPKEEDNEIEEYLTPFCPYCGERLVDVIVPNDAW